MLAGRGCDNGRHAQAILVAGSLAVSVTSQAQTPTAVAAPADVKPGSIGCEECPYPHPSSYLPLTLYDQDVGIS